MQHLSLDKDCVPLELSLVVTQGKLIFLLHYLLLLCMPVSHLKVLSLLSFAVQTFPGMGNLQLSEQLECHRPGL